MTSLPPPAFTHRLAVASLLALILLCVLWEAVVARSGPNTYWLALKALPLVLAVPGVLKARRYTMQWSTLLIWLYFTEGVMRAWSERGAVGVLALMEVVLSLLYFVAVVLFLRATAPAKATSSA
jgi:uncharacterized membrane protein